MSLDDLSLNSYTSRMSDSGRKSRSLSPAKKRQSFPTRNSQMGLGIEYSCSLDDLKSINSMNTRTLPLDKLKLLSRSSVSSRLFVTKSSVEDKHVIPIPFVLKMPPKLSKKKRNSGISSPKGRKGARQLRLVYTGNSYERLDSSSESESDISDEFSKLDLPPRPTKENVTSSQITFQTNHLSHDELSVIEEVSNIDMNSRKSSMRSAFGKPSMVPLPKQEVPHEINPLGPIVEPPQRGKSLYGNVQQMDTITEANPMPQPAYVNVRFVSNPSLDVNALQMNDSFHNSTVPMVANPLPHSYTIADFGQYLGPKLQFYNDENELRIHKRSFSDESKVSSVSSFSSVGDVLRISEQNDIYNDVENEGSNEIEIEETPESEETLSNVQPLEVRSSASSLTDETIGSNGSWNSVQKSIDISYHDGELSEVTKNNEGEMSILEENQYQEKVLPPLPIEVNEQDSQNEELDFIDIYERPDLSIVVTQDDTIIEEVSYNANNPIESPKEIENDEEILDAQHVEEEVQPDSSGDSENGGLGRKFSFPNNAENVTNKQLDSDLDNKTSSRSDINLPILKDGQIEIPDLDNCDSELYSLGRSVCSFKGTLDDVNSMISQSVVEDDYERPNETKLDPIGVPSREAKKVIEEQFGDLCIGDGSDTDSDSIKGSLYSSFSKSKSAPCLAIKKNGPLPPIPVEKNESKPVSRPIRKHTRHKSLFDIDFKDDGPAIAKQRSLSHNVLASQKQEAAKPVDILTSNSNKMVIEEPPTQVSYEIDFKEAEKMESCLRQEPDQFAKIRENYIKQLGERRNKENSTSREKNNFTVHNPFIATVDDMSSISASSYQSSRSAKATTATSLTDDDNIMIDLTKDDYDVCMIKRNNSTHSYVSVTEKNKEGKEVEVILVDDDTEQRDELASIYSKYKTSWVSRSNSKLSNSSYASSASFSSDIPSEKQLRLKPVNDSLVNKYREMNNIRGNIKTQQPLYRSNTTSTTSSNYNSSRIKHPKNITKNAKTFSINNTTRNMVPGKEGQMNYFDYSSNQNYDFSSYMKQQSFN